MLGLVSSLPETLKPRIPLFNLLGINSKSLSSVGFPSASKGFLKNQYC